MILKSRELDYLSEGDIIIMIYYAFLQFLQKRIVVKYQHIRSSKIPKNKHTITK